MADAPTERWSALGLSLDSKGRPYPNADNARRILRDDPVWKGRIWYDDFHQKIRCAASPHARNIRDADEVEFLIFCQSILQIPKMSIDAVRQAFLRVADGSRRDEAREYFDALKWDGQKRLPEAMITGFGAEPTDYHEAVGGVLFKSIAARATRPGCKQDSVIILEGEQGIKKSTAVEVLGGDFYGALHSGFGDKDAYLEMAGKLVIEISELAAFRGQEITKKFITKRADNFRAPYARHPTEVPRRCVFVGTTNDCQYLSDPTGGRRFLPVKCGLINVEWLKEKRDQLYAEALARINAGEEWWLITDDEAREEQAARFQEDPWLDLVRDYLIGKDSTRVAILFKEALKLDTGRQSKKEEMRVAAILKLMGWQAKTVGPAHRRVRTWHSPDAAMVANGTTVVHLNAKTKQDTEQREQHEQPITNNNDG